MGVVGATGFIGRNLLAALAAAGIPTRAIVRRPGTVRALPSEVEVVPGDLTAPGLLPQALAGCTAVVNLVGIIRGNVQDFETVHREGTRNLADAARAAGVGRLVYVSAQGADPASANPYFRTKAEAEAAVVASGLPHLILRPCLVLGPGDGFSTQLAALLRRAPVVPVIGTGRYPLRPVAVDDVVAALVQGALGRVEGCYVLAGPEEVSYETLLRRAMQAMGIRKSLVHLPLGVAQPTVRAMELCSDHPPLTSLQLSMLLEGNIGDPDPAVAAFGLRLTPLDTALRRAMGKKETPT